MSNQNDKPDCEERVLFLAPTTGDAALTRNLLAEAGFACHICAELTELCWEIAVGAGAVLLTEEALGNSLPAGDETCGEDPPDLLVATLQEQPSWSDLPILLLTTRGADSPLAVTAMSLLGNVTVLERPVRVTTLISSLRAALRARRRQYELRNQVDTLRRQGERLRLLWEMASVLLSTDRPDAMMRGLFDRIAPHFGLDAYFSFMLDESGDALRLESCAGILEEQARKIKRLEFGQAICGTVARERRPIMATNIQNSCDRKTQLVKSYGIRVYACNPLMAGDRLLGTLSFASRSKDSFAPDELEFLQTVCHYVAGAYERLRLIGQLRDADRKKDDFLAVLAHELRNPLAPIRNAAQYLRLKGPSGPEIDNARDIIDRQLRQMTRLVDELLDLSRITQGKVTLQRERVSLGVVLASAVESSRPAIEAAGHELAVSLPPESLFLKGDLTRLSQVFGNLLTNAAKYTDRGGRIGLVAERQGGDAVVTVRDNGIGIAAEHLPGIFSMFSQVAPALERSQGGLGIGLALVRSLVEMHDGQVEARSAGSGRGSEFVVRLPLLTDDPTTGVESQSRDFRSVNGRSPKCRIVVADDNSDSALSLTMMLSAMGQEVQTAHDGIGAVELAETFRPDVVLLDIGMPRLNGYEVARRIRTQPWGKTMVLCALSGWGQDEDKKRATEAGFDHHFTKPVDPAALQELLDLTKTSAA